MARWDAPAAAKVGSTILKSLHDLQGRIGFPKREQDESLLPELGGGLTGAALPLASLHQYHNQYVPLMKRLFRNTPIYSSSEMGNRLRFGDIGFEGIIGPGSELTVDANLAKAFQGTPLYHAFVMGNRHKLYHGGGHSIYGGSVKDLAGQITDPVIDVISRYGGDQDALLRDLRSGRLVKRIGNQLHRSNLHTSRQTSLLGKFIRDPEDWKNFERRHVTPFSRYYKEWPDETALFMRPNVTMNPGMRSDIQHLFKRMSGAPYSNLRATLGGLRNILLPSFGFGRGTGSSTLCALDSSMCGELPAAALKAMGLNTRPVGTTLASDVMANPALTPVGIMSHTLNRPQIRAALMDQLEAASNSRTRLGLLGALGLGALGAGAVSLRHIPHLLRNESN